MGQVHTGLLAHSTSLSPGHADHVLGLLAGGHVRRSERPIAYAVSPDLLTGVDCRLATESGARVRGVGTAVHRATITGGHVLQGSASVRLARIDIDDRRPWAHYLARPGTLEVVGKIDWADLARGFATARPPRASLDLGAVADRLVDEVQLSRRLDRRPPFRAVRTRLRWAAELAGDAAERRVGFTVENGVVRTLHLVVGTDQVSDVVLFCEDLALHDWLLTTLLSLVERSRIGGGSRADTISLLRPAVDHLIHLWMPGVRLRQPFIEVWDALERRPGFSRQWRAIVDRVRDQLALGVITLLGGVPGSAQPGRA